MDNISGCSYPLLPKADYPSLRGDIAARFCANLTISDTTSECCLPCPATDWVYSEAFGHKASIGNYVSIAALILHSWLLVTFFVLPEEKSHRHYLSVGLCVSFIMIALAFVIPLTSKPDLCYNDITPNNLHTDASCGATGVLVEAGAMGVVVWILLRSIWTTLRIMTKFRHHNAFKWITIGLGIAIPTILLAVSLAISGVSYRLGPVCIPNKASALATWFLWILVFAGVSWIIQVVTILFCLWRFASSMVAGPTGKSTMMTKSSVSTATADSEGGKGPQVLSARQRQRQSWRKVKRVLLLQWRSILLAFLIVNLTVFFGMAFIEQNLTTHVAPGTVAQVDLEWFVCLMLNDGDKRKCRVDAASGLGLTEERAVATLTLSTFLGIAVFPLMVRWSMVVGWYELLRNPKTLFRRGSTGSEDFVMLSPRAAAAQEQHNQLPSMEGGVRRRSSGQVTRPSNEFERGMHSETVTPVASPGKAHFVDVPVGGGERGGFGGGVKKEEDVMV